MTADDRYLSRANLYRAACTARSLPDNFTASLRWWLIRDATDVPIPGTDNVRTDPFTTALRAAIGEAESWRGEAEASRELGQEEEGTSKLATYHAASSHQAVYCANMLLRRIAQELYREHVPREERVQ